MVCLRASRDIGHGPQSLPPYPASTASACGGYARAVSPDWALVEREGELEQLRAAIAAARSGEGALVVVEAPAGYGKTELLRALRREADSAGTRLLAATGAELERDFPFGVVLQMFEAELRGAAEQRRAQLLDGAARAALALFEPGEAPESFADVSFSRLHGLYWLAANLAAERPLVLVVDDAHWADSPSLRFIDVLARRLDGLPILLAVGARPAEPGVDAAVLDDLVAHADARVLRPAPLTVAGVTDLLTRELGETVEEPFAVAALDTTAGSPLLLRELARALAARGFAGGATEADALREVLPGNVGRLVIGRLRRLAPDASVVARSVAVLGDGAETADVAALADVPAQRAAAVHGVLAAAGLLHPDTWHFVHPMVREAVHADLVGSARDEWHWRAAAVRQRAGAESAELAAHLVNTEPRGLPWAAAALADAGRRALLDGAAEVAVRHLRRALAEPPAEDARAAVLLALGEAEARSGEAAALEHLAQSAACGDPQTAARADRLRAQVLLLHGRTAESVEVLRDAVDAASERDPRLAGELEDDLVDVLAHHAPLRAEYLARLEAGSSQERPTFMSHLAFVRAITGAPAQEVIELARRALARPGLEGSGRFMHFYAFEALMVVEAAEASAAALREATSLAQRLGSRVVAGPLSYMPSSWAAWERRFGDLRQAEEQARQGLELTIAARASAVVATLRCALAAILVDRGELDAADALFAQLPEHETGPGLREMHAMRGRLRLLQGRPEEAVAELERELELERVRGWVSGNREPSRLTLVRALVALDRRDEAVRVAEGEWQIAQRRGIAGVRARARLARALTLGGADRLAELRAAADDARRSPSRLVGAEVIGELGGALRRGGERAEARELLAEARDLAHRCGATGLEARLLEELVVAGARPRRVPVAGVDSLTASERRVADLAAGGMRNREIAEALFVTVKTVEVHLGRAYGKLNIKSRAQLAEALAA